MTHDPFNNDFFKQHDKNFNSAAKKGAGLFAGAGCLVILLNLAIVCGVIYFIFWCLQHFGVI